MLHRRGVELGADCRKDFFALRAFCHDAYLDEFVSFQGQRDFLQHRFGQARVAYHHRWIQRVRAAFQSEALGYGKR